MRFTAAFLILLFWPFSALAAQVDVRTGEHATFTRVVLNIPQDADWRLGRRAEGYVLRIPQADGFNLEGFFDIIPRQRITAVSQTVDGHELRLDIGCVCNARAYLFRPGVLVIDIGDGPPTRISSFELTLDVPSAPASQNETRPTPAIPYNVSQNRLLPLLPRPAPSGPPANAEPPMLRDIMAEQDVAPAASDNDIRNAIATLEQSIVAGLGDALTGGLLESRVDASQPMPDDIAGRLDEILGETRGLPGVNARTSVDQNALPSNAPPDQTQTGQTCLPDSYFDVVSWGDTRPFFDQLNTARRAIVPEFERVDEEAVTQLARLYVHFGFGREAIQTLGIDQVKSQERQYLQALAHLVDGDMPDDGLFDGQVSCPTSVALWATLAAPSLPFDAQVDAVAILTAFRSLPTGLQNVLAVPLSERLLEIGDTDGALQVLGRTQNSAADGSARVLADAALLDALGEDEEAVDVVSEAARSDPRTTPELMIRFFEDGIATGAVFSDDDFTLSDALLFEKSGAAGIADLAAAQIKAYVSVERFDDALMLLRRSAEQLDEDAARDLQNHIYQRATVALDDVSFLRFVVTDDEVLLGPDARNAIADRLIGLGFPGPANRFLIGAANRGDDAQPSAGAVDPAVQSLAGAPAEQVQSLEEVPVQVMSDQTPDQRLAEIVARIGQDRIGPLDPDMPLTSGRALLESAAQSRAALDELLEAFVAPDGL